MPENATTETAPVEFSEQYLLVAEANRRSYAQVHDRYLKHVRCANDEGDQGLLEQDLRRAVDWLRRTGVVSPAGPVRALDACGGGGNAALKLQKLGCRVTLADITPQLIQNYVVKCAVQACEADTVCCEIGKFLSETDQRFDLIVFCSALHHLQDPVLVLSLARRALVPGGVVVTIFDPVRQPKWIRAVREPVRMMERGFKQPRLVFTRFVPVLKRLARGGPGYKHRGGGRLRITEDNMGNIAEFHADSGFDDRELAAALVARGYRVLHHDRFYGGCGRIQRLVLRLLRRPNSFKLLLQNAA